MSKIASLWSSFWSDRNNRRMSVAEKLLFLFLISYRAQSGGSVSGVYIIDADEIEHYTGLPPEVVLALFEGKHVKVTYSIAGEDAIRDADTERASEHSL